MSDVLHRIIDSAVAGVALISPSGKFIRVNPSWCRMLAYTEAELLELNISDVTHPDSLANTRAKVAELLAGGPDFLLEKRYVRSDGATLWALSSVSAIRNATGSVETIAAVICDITEQKENERRALLLGELGRTLATMDEPGVCLKEIACAFGRHLDLSCAIPVPVPEDATDRSKNPATAIVEAVRRHLPAHEVLAISDRTADPRLSEEERSALSELGVSALLAVPVHRAREGPLVVYSPLPRHWKRWETDLACEVAARAAAALERHDVHEALKRSEGRCRSLLYSIDEGIALFRVVSADSGKPADLVFVEANRGFKQHTETNPAPGTGLLDIFPQLPADSIALLAEVARTGRHLEMDEPLEILPGHWLSLHASRAGSDGEVAILLEDITHRKELEDARKDDESRLRADLTGTRTLYELFRGLSVEKDLRAALDAIVGAAVAFAGTDRGCIQLLSEDGERLESYFSRGYSPDDLAVRQFLHQCCQRAYDHARQNRRRLVIEDLASTAAIPEKERQQGLDAGIRATCSMPMVCRSGLLTGVLSVHYPEPHRPTGHEVRMLDLLAWAAAEYLETHKARLLLRESEQRFRAMVEQTEVGVAMIDTQERLIWLNDRQCEIMGGTREKLLNRTIQEVTHPDDWPENERLLRRMLESGEPFVIEKRHTPRGGATRWNRLSVSPRRDASGNIIGGIAMTIDITDRKVAEEALQQSEQQLEARVAERTAELASRAEQLSRLTSELTLAEQRERRRLAHILHDHLQQLLVAAKMNLDFFPHGSEAPGATAASDRVASLLDEAIAASRTLSMELSPPILHDAGLCAGFQWLARWMAEKHRLKVALDLDQKAEPRRDDVTVLLFESVRELLFNVVKHAGTHHARLVLSRGPDDRIKVVVEDQGRGFDQATHRQRTGAQEQGFGLLSINERLSLLGGEVTCDSEPGRGTRFTLIAPLHGIATAQAPAGDPKAASGPSFPVPPAGNPEHEPIRVLLVDDHRMVREGLAMLVGNAPGMIVAGEATDGLEAVRLARELHPDVVLMDYSIPGLNGATATRTITRELPDTRVIGLSMFDEAEKSAAMMDAGAVAYLCKSGPSVAVVEQIREVAHRRG